MSSQKHIKEIQEYYDVYLASELGKLSSVAEFQVRYEPVLSFLRKISKYDTEIFNVGYGIGLAAEKLRTFGNAYGLDISPGSIKEAANRLDRVCASLVRGDYA